MALGVGRRRPPLGPRRRLKILLDTHFLIWLLMGSRRLEAFPWIGRYRPWGVSPVSFLELQFLHEIGKLEVRMNALVEAVGSDTRFLVDDPPLLALVTNALASSWTRDPFDRLITAHSTARRVALCTTDRWVQENHPLVVRELR